MTEAEQAWMRIQKYCAYQERCHQEVRTKLLLLGVKGLDLEEMIVRLIEHNFLNEERFSRAFARGKFRVKKWGKQKIVQELKRRNISEYCIKKGLEEIEDVSYDETLLALIEKKSSHYAKLSEFDRNGKLAQYCIRKGWEPNLVWETIKSERWK